MKKITMKIVRLIITITVYLSFIGCGYNNTNTSKDKAVIETQSKTSDTNSTKESTKKTKEVDDNEMSKELVPPKTRDEVELDEESSKLYAEFIAGKVAAEYSVNADRSRYLSLSQVLQDNKKYTLGEIVDNVKVNGEENEWHECLAEGNCVEEYVDLGLDGSYELKLELGTLISYMTMVVKNVDGELKICFVGDSWEQSVTNVWYAGDVTIFNIDSYTQHSAEDGFLDENGDYYLWYKSSEEGFNVYQDDDLIYNNQYIASGIGMYVEERNIEGENASVYYYVVLVDQDNNRLKENKDTKEYYEKAREALAAEGKNVITEEAKIKLEEVRKDIGFSDELYYYGSKLEQ